MRTKIVSLPTFSDTDIQLLKWLNDGNRGWDLAEKLKTSRDRAENEISRLLESANITESGEAAITKLLEIGESIGIDIHPSELNKTELKLIKFHSQGVSNLKMGSYLQLSKSNVERTIDSIKRKTGQESSAPTNWNTIYIKANVEVEPPPIITIQPTETTLIEKQVAPKSKRTKVAGEVSSLDDLKEEFLPYLELIATHSSNSNCSFTRLSVILTEKIKDIEQHQTKLKATAFTDASTKDAALNYFEIMKLLYKATSLLLKEYDDILEGPEQAKLRMLIESSKELMDSSVGIVLMRFITTLAQIIRDDLPPTALSRIMKKS